MQEWLSTAMGVLVILLASGFMFRKFSRKSGNGEPAISSGQSVADLSVDDDGYSKMDDVSEHGVIAPRNDHPVSRKNISDNALKVLHRLTSNGYDTYLVGGCIRDLYLGLRPKDFDVATSATPEEVRRLFRNSRVIGRRFKLVHILFGQETIEVATFRAGHSAGEPISDHSRHSESGRILRDNVYGSIEDDALRRDFTVNALYYDSRDFTVVDYCGGIDDLYDRQLRLIGDARVRYHEDPVRMLRAIRFAAKLDFDIAPETEEPIRELAPLLRDIPAARLFDEMLKLLQSGNGAETFELLRTYELLKHLFPATSHSLDDQDECFEELIRQALMSTDERVKNERPVTPAFLFAALLWSPLQRLTRDIQDQGVPPIPALQQAAMTVLENQVRHTAIPRRFSMGIREIWELQARLERRQPRTIGSLLEHPRFRAAYDFLVLREAAGEQLGGAGAWWANIQKTCDPDRQQMISTLKERNNRGPGNKRRRRRHKPRRPDDFQQG